MAITVLAPTFDSRGNPIRLGPEVGRGGEGTVHQVGGRRDVAAKVFHKRLDNSRAWKLVAMTKLQSDGLLRHTAWPVDTLHASRSGPIVGVLVPLIQGRKSVHLLYSPKSRREEFPSADWRFLIRTASNVARAFAVIHQHGHIVGDINEQNILVAENATVKIIDCDSFQISKNGTTFTCDVGVPTYTPPELQQRNLRSVVRTQNHDAFGLAVLIFHLLFMGRHPFVGNYLGSGEMPIARAIREFRFAYGPSAALRNMQPPPHSLPLTALPASLNILFQRGFARLGARNSSRPKGQEWVEALSALESELRTCGNNHNHVYYRALASCPWCTLLRSSGVEFFTFRNPQDPRYPSFELDAVWRQITSVPPPDSAPELPVVPASSMTPSAEAVTHGQRRRKRRRTLLVGALKYGLAPFLILAAVLSVHVPIELAGFMVVTLLLLAGHAGHWYTIRGSQEIRATVRQQLDHASSLFQESESRWSEEATDKRFTAKLKQLEQLRAEYLQVKQEKDRKLAELRSTLREREFERCLEGSRIVPGIVSGIGRSHLATLRSFGIETAADVQVDRILALPKFGPKLAQDLVSWRRSVEQQFVFNPNMPLPAEDHVRVDREFESTLTNLEKELQAGAQQLRSIAADIKAKRSLLLHDRKNRSRALAQAQANWNAL